MNFFIGSTQINWCFNIKISLVCNLKRKFTQDLFGGLRLSEIKDNSVEYYWKIAKEYIIKQSKYLDESEPKYYLDKELGYKYIKFASIMKTSSW